jgi:hypothetical protein
MEAVNSHIPVIFAMSAGQAINLIPIIMRGLYQVADTDGLAIRIIPALSPAQQAQITQALQGQAVFD